AITAVDVPLGNAAFAAAQAVPYRFVPATRDVVTLSAAEAICENSRPKIAIATVAMTTMAPRLVDDSTWELTSTSTPLGRARLLEPLLDVASVPPVPDRRLMQ